MNKHIKQKGAALLIFIIFFTVASTSLVLILARGIFSDVLTASTLAQSKQSYLLADTFTENIAYRFIFGMAPDPTESVALFGAEATTTSSFSVFDNAYQIETRADASTHYRASYLALQLGAGASFNFGVQTGNGGFSMTNSSEVIGNVFSNGSIIGAGPSLVRGDAISAGPSGLINGVTATGSAWANTINNSIISGDAHYQNIDAYTISNTGGTLYSGWPDEATTSLPVPDSVVDGHKASVTEAIAAGVGTLITATSSECSGGEYEISSDTVLNTGPLKIECDFAIRGNNTDVTFTDTIWVEGNLSFKSGPNITANPATSTNSILVIVDNESNRITSSQIEIENGTSFVAPTSPKSYIVLLSMNEDAENGGTETAITIGQSSGGSGDDFLAYAGHGKITLANQISLKEVTAYQIEMGNNSTITYESGLLNVNFTSGPGGGYEIMDWQEIQ